MFSAVFSSAHSRVFTWHCLQDQPATTQAPLDPGVCQEDLVLTVSEDQQDLKVIKDLKARVHQKVTVINLEIFLCNLRMFLFTHLNLRFYDNRSCILFCDFLTVSVVALVALLLSAVNTCFLASLSIHLYKSHYSRQAGTSHSHHYVIQTCVTLTSLTSV